MNKRTVIKVRYLNTDDSVSRPRKIQKIVTEGEVKYYPMSVGSIGKNTHELEIDPSSFTTHQMYEKAKVPIITIKEETEIEIVRVRFKDVRKKGNGIGRPTRVYKYTTGNTVGYKHIRADHKFNPAIDPDTFITKWDAGPTPTPKAPIRYSDERLMEEFHWTPEQCKANKRGFSAKDIQRLRRKLGTQNMSQDQAREALTKYGSIRKAEQALDAEIQAHSKRIEEALSKKYEVVHMGRWTRVYLKDDEKKVKTIKRTFKGFEKQFRHIILTLKKNDITMPKEATIKELYDLYNVHLDELRARRAEAEYENRKSKDWKHPIKGEKPEVNETSTI